MTTNTNINPAHDVLISATAPMCIEDVAQAVIGRKPTKADVKPITKQLKELADLGLIEMEPRAGGVPYYQLTSTPPSAPKAAALAVRQASSTPEPTDVTEQLRELRANELALSQTITEICCALGADPAKTTTTELVEMFKKQAADHDYITKLTKLKSDELHAQAAVVEDLRQRLDRVTQQSLKDIELLTEKNRKLHEELEHLRASPPAAATLETRTPTGYAMFDSTGGATRHKRIEAATRSAARSIRAGASQADVVATYIVARAKRGVQIDKV